MSVRHTEGPNATTNGAVRTDSVWRPHQNCAYQIVNSLWAAKVRYSWGVQKPDRAFTVLKHREDSSGLGEGHGGVIMQNQIGCLLKCRARVAISHEIVEYHIEPKRLHL